jgi:hypothetical protein
MRLDRYVLSHLKKCWEHYFIEEIEMSKLDCENTLVKNMEEDLEKREDLIKFVNIFDEVQLEIDP